MSHVENLRLNGLTKIENCFSHEQCANFVTELEEIVEKNSKSLKYTLGENATFTPNFFRHNLELLALVDIPQVGQIFNEIIDEDHVLVACNAINRCKSQENPDAIEVGQNWHTDSRYIGQKRMQPGVFFSVMVMLDDFTTENGATSYVPNSHLRTDRPKRDGQYEGIEITGHAGDVVIFDSGLWHKGGEASKKRRWSVFNLYGPWFIKPYFNFPLMLEDKVNDISKSSARLLHFNSTPPIDETERFSTLLK
ncbi:phytanoyl-CoA dioxygenase family protein [Alphaproteobacteria bacterium]|nr:phytanoyl-CoA dioxygenase family protein [Alphaproteobacteria bacterium]